jgi:hypothetical protein
MAVARDAVHNSILLANRPKKPSEAMARPGEEQDTRSFFHFSML